MSTRLSKSQQKGKSKAPYKYYLTMKEILRKKRCESMTDWNNELQRAAERAIEVTTAIIRKDGPKSKPYCVYSEKTGRKFGCYKTRDAAKKRLAQIKMFRNIKKKN